MRRGVSPTGANPMCPLFCDGWHVSSVEKAGRQAGAQNKKVVLQAQPGAKGAQAPAAHTILLGAVRPIFNLYFQLCQPQPNIDHLLSKMKKTVSN